MSEARRGRWGRVGSIASVATVALSLVGCGAPARQQAEAMRSGGPHEDTIVVREVSIPTVIEAFGTAAPIHHAVLSTKLMGTVGTVVPVAGTVVTAGTVLVRIDAREVAAGRSQAAGAVAAAEAAASEAETQAVRIRALYADSAAPRAQFDAMEAALARARAGVATARAGADAAAAAASYAEIRAPFDGIVSARYVDPGTFVTPGTPMLVIDDVARLRVSAPITPEIAAHLRPGRVLTARVENRLTTARIEGVVPVALSAVYDVNALIDNRDRLFLTGSAATLLIPTGSHQGVRLPTAAIVRDGDLAGVRVRSGTGQAVRWVRVSAIDSSASEVLSGLTDGDVVVLRHTEVGDP